MSELIMKYPDSVRAKYSPKSTESITGPLDDCRGKEYLFSECRSVRGVRKFMPRDKNFPSSSPVAESDLIFKNETIPASN